MQIADFNQLVSDYNDAKKTQDEWDKKVSTLKQTLLDYMETNHMTKYFAEGVGTVSLVERKSVKTPKTNEDKALLFEYMRSTYGEEFVQSMLTVNSKTLNSFYNEEANKGDGIAEFRLPGLEPPTSSISLRFRKKT